MSVLRDTNPDRHESEMERKSSEEVEPQSLHAVWPYFSRKNSCNEKMRVLRAKQVTSTDLETGSFCSNLLPFAFDKLSGNFFTSWIRKQWAQTESEFDKSVRYYSRARDSSLQLKRHLRWPSTDRVGEKLSACRRAPSLQLLWKILPMEGLTPGQPFFSIVKTNTCSRQSTVGMWTTIRKKICMCIRQVQVARRPSGSPRSVTEKGF